jgi:hypothetical protein
MQESESMATQQSRFRQLLAPVNLSFVKILPTSRKLAPNVATAARNDLGQIRANTLGTPPNPGVVNELERAKFFALMQKAMRVTRFQG